MRAPHEQEGSAHPTGCPGLCAILGIVLISLALYFSGKRETAIFVGLWAPTILNLGQSLLDED
jgi:hypothetical protein